MFTKARYAPRKSYRPISQSLRTLVRRRYTQNKRYVAGLKWGGKGRRSYTKRNYFPARGRHYRYLLS